MASAARPIATDGGTGRGDGDLPQRARWLHYPKMPSSTGLGAALCVLLSAGASAQEPPPVNPPTAPLAEPPLGGADAPLEAAEEDAASFAPRLAIAGFGDVGYTAQPPQGENASVQIGGFDLYATGSISEHWSALLELVFENDDNQLVTDLERFVVSYEHSNLLRIDGGRTHSPIVRWNLTQHHGVFLQTPIERPAIARFEDQPGLWPVHFVGLTVSGALQEASGFSYLAGVGNGRGPVLDEVQAGSDANGRKAALLSLGAAPRAASGFDVHATAYWDDIPASAGSIGERIFTGSASYLANALEVRAEWSRMEHRPDTRSEIYRTTGWYVLASRRLPGRLDALRPYVMRDRLLAADDDAFLEGAADYDAWVFGLRADFGGAVALKGEYASERVGDGERDSVVRFQAAVSLGPNR